MNELSFIPENTRAVLIGNSHFPKDRKRLAPLLSIKSNIYDFEQILSDPKIIGIPRRNIITLLDEQNPHTVLYINQRGFSHFLCERCLPKDVAFHAHTPAKSEKNLTNLCM